LQKFHFCIVNCKEDYDHLKLACEPIFQKINTLCEKASIEVEGKHFDLDILMGGIHSKRYKLLISSWH
jgi:hypothetical protein